MARLRSLLIIVACVAIAFLVAAVLFGWAAKAHSICVPREVMAKMVEKYNETTVFRGIVPSTSEPVFLAISPNGSFTVYYLRVDGVACLLATGKLGEMIAPEKNAGPKT